MSTLVNRLVCRIRGHKWHATHTPITRWERAQYEPRNGFTYWTEPEGGEQIPVVDGRACRLCGLTIWEDAE